MASGGGGGAGMPGGAAAAMPGRRGGISMDFSRQSTAKRRLQLEWNYPVFAPERGAAPAQAGGTASRVEDYALPREEALRWVADGDRRPLLVLRECNRCKGTDDALLNRRMDNERTQLLASWFRCVKLPVHVLEAKHPFHALFADEHPPHLFLCRHDGSNVVALTGDRGQKELWLAMEALIAEAYERPAGPAVAEWIKLLSQFDHLDTAEALVREKLDTELEKNGPDSPRMKKLQADLAKLHKQREAALDKERQIRDLGLRPAAEPARKDG
jgi:hypothetical protein